MRELPLEIKNERRLKSMTGLDYAKYQILLKVFTFVLETKASEKAVPKVRKRSVGGGRKSALPSPDLKLLFLLYYLKAYPTFDLLGDRFNMATSTANIHVHNLMPFLHSALENLDVMPKRSYESADAFKTDVEKHGGVSEILIDATEREYFRYQDSEKRNAMYSGKKKDLRLKIQS